MRAAVAAVLAVLVLALPGAPADAGGTTTGCRDLGTVNGFGQVGEPMTVTVGDPATYPTAFCRVRGFRSYRAYANTPAEADRLAQVAAWSEGTGFAAVYCRNGDRARYMDTAQTWGAGGVVHLSVRELEYWNRYARGWAARRGCEVYR